MSTLLLCGVALSLLLFSTRRVDLVTIDSLEGLPDWEDAVKARIAGMPALRQAWLWEAAGTLLCWLLHARAPLELIWLCVSAVV